MTHRNLAALSAALTATTAATVLALAPASPAVADAPIGVGLLDPSCVVQVTVLGTVVCAVSVTQPGGTTTSTTPPTSTTTATTTETPH